MSKFPSRTLRSLSHSTRKGHAHVVRGKNQRPWWASSSLWHLAVFFVCPIPSTVTHKNRKTEQNVFWAASSFYENVWVWSYQQRDITHNITHRNSLLVHDSNERPKKGEVKAVSIQQSFLLTPLDDKTTSLNSRNSWRILFGLRPSSKSSFYDFQLPYHLFVLLHATKYD